MVTGFSETSLGMLFCTWHEGSQCGLDLSGTVSLKWCAIGKVGLKKATVVNTKSPWPWPNREENKAHQKRWFKETLASPPPPALKAAGSPPCLSGYLQERKVSPWVKRWPPWLPVLLGKNPSAWPSLLRSFWGAGWKHEKSKSCVRP